MSTHHDDSLRRHLAGLTYPAPSPDLFGRIERSRVQRRRRRLWLRGTAVVVLLLGALLPLRGLLAPPPASVPVAELAPPDADEIALRRIDRQLQAAYDRGADSDTLQTLWLARERAAVHTRTPEAADDTVISL
jgi:hypothetical protein